uniref:ADP-ribosylglycohydrolase n=1 Tax=Pyrodinium bahamense TaxID=73915 RepID=A0A7S0AEC3_9DINO|mmetsp:Transcript_32731/g.90383  ORF Transcript_32731/g.90383 Transcript_32731/m.90383 type:complete len:607 (+) Transcript_32731:58-1878(+)
MAHTASWWAAQPHPHMLTRKPPKSGLAALLCYRGRHPQCAGCGEQLSQRMVHYKCDSKPKPCRYYLCESCFHLRPGEGGLKATASFFSKTDDPTTHLDTSSCLCCAPRRAAQPQIESTSSSRTINSELSSVDSAAELANTPVVPTSQPPRIAAADLDFGLEVDAAAHERWADFVKRHAAHDDAERKMFELAQRCADHLRFLKLVVLGEEELHKEQQSKRKECCLELYSPYAKIPMKLKTEVVAAACALPQASRALGAVVGMTVGDALGAPFEFLDAVDEVGASRSRFDLHKFKGFYPRNRFRVKRGQWTDDGSMGLCLADTLLARGCYDGSDARVRFHNWWFRGYNNAFGNDDRVGSVGLGGNVAESLRSMVPYEDPSPNYEALTEDAGNGSLMRLAPVPVFLSRDAQAAARCSAQSSFSTHPGRVAAAAAAFFGFTIARAITRDKDSVVASDFLDSVVKEFTMLGFPGAEGCEEVSRLLKSAEPEGSPEECWNWRSSRLNVQSSLLARGSTYNGYPCYPDYFGSYCIDGLAVALWSFYHTRSFMEAVVRCVNFLGDADTMAAMCGQLAGAFYGYGAIDQRCIDAMEVWDNKDIACRGALLHITRL